MKRFLVSIQNEDGGAELHPMKLWLRGNPDAAPGIDPTSMTSHRVRDELRKRGWTSEVRGDEVVLEQPRVGPRARRRSQPAYEPVSEQGERQWVKALVPDTGDGSLPEIDSVVELFPTAEFQEREIYDFFGIRFRGHPDPRRILMPEDYVGFPQRRDFPVGGDPVIFTNTEDTVPGWTK